MRTLLIVIAFLCSASPLYADAPVIWFGQWAKSLTNLGLEAKGLKLDKDFTGTPAVTIIPSGSLATSWQMTLPVDDGTANYVLATDGFGVTSWADPTSLITGAANTFAGYTSGGGLSSVPGWSWINATGGANVQLNPVPTTGEGTVNLHTFGSSLNPATNVTGSTWIQNQSEINVGSDDSGNSFSADGSGGVTGLQVNVNSRNKSDVGQIAGISQNTQIGNGTDTVASDSYQGITSNFSVSDNAIAQNQNYAFSSQFGLGTSASTNNFTTLQGNINSTGTTNELRGVAVGGNANDISSYFLGYSSNFNFNNVQNYQGFSSNSNIAGTVANSYSAFSAAGNVATTNGVTVFADFLNLTNNATNGYTSYNATPTIGATNSYIGLNVQPNMSTINNYVSIIDTGGTASVTVPNWTDINIHPNLPLVTDGYKGINITPTAVGDGSGYATVGYFDTTNLTNFSAGQVLAIQTQGDAQINGKLNAFAGITPIDQGGNPNAVHSMVSGVTTAANTTTANVDTIGVNTASLMTISTNSINTSGAFGLGLSALALPAVLKTETGSSIDYVNAAVFATSLDPTSSGGTVDELTGGRFTVIPQGGTHTINKLKLVKAELPFGDPATQSWGIYSSSTTSENWFAKNLKIGGTAGSTDVVTDAGSKLQIDGGSIDVLNGQLKNSSPDGPIYLTPSGFGYISANVPDSTAVGGNARGTYALDLQWNRNDATQVASGGVSIVMGALNKATADFSMALGGANNAATAQKAVTLGGADNTAAHQGAYVFGTGGLSQTDGDFIFSSGGAPSAEANNYFRLAGDTHSLHIGVYDNAGATGFDNALLLHGRDGGTQSEYIGLKAPDTVTTATTFTLPDGDGTANQVLKTDGSANLGWVTAPTNGSTFLAADGTAAAPGFAFNSDTNVGLYRVGADSLGFATAGVTAGNISSTGAWTIGNQSGSSLTHEVQSNADTNLRIQAGAASTSTLEFWNGSGDRGSISTTPGGTMQFKAIGGTVVGQRTDAGVWTLGDPTNAASPGNIIVGRKNGSAPTAGAVGEILEASSTSVTNFSTDISNGGFGFSSGTQLNYYFLYNTGAVGDAAAKLTLTPGVWRIESGIRWAANAGAFSEIQFRLYNSSSAAGASAAPLSNTHVFIPSTSGPQGDTAYMTGTANISSSTTYYPYIFFVGNSSTLTVNSVWTRAIRID